MAYRANHRLTQAVLQGQFGPASHRCADCSDIGRGYLGLPEPALYRRILHVVRLRAGEQVRRIKTTPVVARVTNGLPDRRDAVKGRERYTMRGEENPLSVLPIAQLPIACLRVDGVRPPPATINTFKVARYRSHPAFRRTELLYAATGDKGASARSAHDMNRSLDAMFAHAVIIAKSTSYYRETNEQIAARL